MTTGDESGGDEDDPLDDLPDGGDESGQGCAGDQNCQNQIDLLFVIDNSNSMAEEQLNLAVQFSDLIERLEKLEDGSGATVGADVNIMVTTSDMWNTSCNGPWVKEDYEAARGRPILDACTDRMSRFIDFDDIDYGHVCTDVCSNVAIPSDPFIHFDKAGDNVEGGTPADALSCLGPQGVDGCGYEAPLESMMQALDPTACWNDPAGCEDAAWDWVERPFLRPGAVLAVVVITDEADCSVKNYDTMMSEAFMEFDPDNADQQRTTSAVCWNAGVECTGYDPSSKTYAECHAVNRSLDGTVVGPEAFDGSTPALQPTSRYIDYLHELRDQGRDVVMLGILGVPEVTAYSEVPPRHPVEGGVEALVYRDWLDADLLPGDPDTASDKHFDFGIGPGCTGFDDLGDTTGQAIPPVRVKEVCESLDEGDNIRCCIESICSTDFSEAIECLTGILQDVVVEG